jgi:predicted protein tyrosine phosphatase
VDVDSIEKRKEIYMEIIQAEDKAALEAEIEYPMQAPQIDYAQDYIKKGLNHKQKLQRKYVKEILAKYGITPESERALYAEALQEQWLLD